MVVPALVYAEHFLYLRLRLQHKIFRTAAAEDKDGGAPAVLRSLITFAVNRAAFAREHYRRRLVDIERRIERQPVALQRLGRDVHADRRIARAGSVNRNGVFIGGCQQRLVPDTERALALVHIAPAEVMELRRGHGLLKLFGLDDLAKESIRVEQHGVIEENIVDANDLFVAQG